MKTMIAIAACVAAVVNGETTEAPDTTEDPCPNAMETPKRMTYTGEANYVVGVFNDAILLPFTFDVCQSISLLNQDHRKYTCTQVEGVWTASYKTYDSASCANEKQGDGMSDTWTMADLAANPNYTDTGVAQFGEFNCDGVNAYAEVQFAAVDSTCTTARTVQVATGVCTADLVTDFVQLYVYCETDLAQLQYYADIGGTVCLEQTLCRYSSATDMCGLLFEVDGIPVYGQIEECVIPDDGDDDSGDADDDEGGDDDSANLASFSPLLLFALAVWRLF